MIGSYYLISWNCSPTRGCDLSHGHVFINGSFYLCYCGLGSSLQYVCSFPQYNFHDILDLGICCDKLLLLRNTLQDLNFRSGLGLVTIYAIKLNVKYGKLKWRINIEKNKTLKWQLKENSECLANKIGFICKMVLYQKIKNVIANQKTR